MCKETIVVRRVLMEIIEEAEFRGWDGRREYHRDTSGGWDAEMADELEQDAIDFLEERFDVSWIDA